MQTGQVMAVALSDKEDFACRQVRDWASLTAKLNPRETVVVPNTTLRGATVNA